MAGRYGWRVATAWTTRAAFLISAAVAALPGRTLVLDGEVAIFDRQFRSRFVKVPGQTDPEDRRKRVRLGAR
jgi:ATP-dependent DNA ligase